MGAGKLNLLELEIKSVVYYIGLIMIRDIQICGKKTSHFWSFTVLELLNSRCELDEGSIMFNPFSMLSLEIRREVQLYFPHKCWELLKK